MLFDTDNRGGTPALDVCARRRRKDGARAMMTPKEKLEMHKRIVRDNERKLKEWKRRKGAAA